MEADAVLRGIAGQGLVALLMLCALLWLNKWNTNLMARADAANLKTLEEKDKRLDDALHRIEALEHAIAECNTDRTALWRKMVEIAQDMPRKPQQPPAVIG